MTTTQQPGQPHSEPLSGTGAAAAPGAVGADAGAVPPPQRARPNLRRINLLPPEVIQERKAQQTRIYAAIGIGALILVLAGIFVWKESEVGAVKQELADTEIATKGLEQQLNNKDLQAAVANKKNLDARIKALAGVIGAEVSMPRVLLQLMLNLPDGVWLSSIQITSTNTGKAAGKVTNQTAGDAAAKGDGDAAAKANAQAAPPKAATPGGTVRLTIKGKCGQLSTAQYLEQLKKTPAISDAWVTSSTKQKGQTSDSCVETQVVDVSATAQLSDKTGTQRGERVMRGDLP